MFRILFSLLSLVILAGEANAQIQWRKDFPSALKEAQDRNLPIFVECWITPCPPCAKMESITFKDISVQTYLNTLTIPVKINDNNFFRTNKVTGLPTQLYFNSEGTFISSHVGYIEARDLIAFIDKNAPKTQKKKFKMN